MISLFTEIQIVYNLSIHADQIEGIFLEYERFLKEDKYPDGTVPTFPTEYLWSMYILAQHYSRKFETLKLAHEYITRALSHTNTVS